ncbi:MAG: YihY/virulence factor BrkB family protein [Oscillospiraceae bacterium]
MSERLERDRVFVYAAQSSFFLLISCIPFLMLFTIIAGALLPLSERDISNVVAQFLPFELRNFGMRFLTEIFRKIDISLLSVTTVALLWTASRGVRAVGDGIQNIYDSSRERGHISRFGRSLIYTIVFALTVVLSLAILVFGAPIESALAERVLLPQALRVILNLKNLIFIASLTFLFMLAYRGLALSGITFRGQFTGALTASIGWTAFSALYSEYIARFSNYTYLYGSLAAVMFFMLWLYFCLTIFLLGAEINSLIYAKKRYSQFLDI